MTIHINLSAIQRNWKRLNSASGNAAAVVKANGYGLGADKVAEALYAVGCRAFFVAKVKEALVVRPVVQDAVIYILHGVHSKEEIDWCVEHNLRPVVSHVKAWDMLEGCDLTCAVHFDTGMHRLGVPEDEQAEMFARMRGTSSLKVSLVMSHLASSELKDAPQNKIQLEKFKKIASEFPEIPASLSNSSGIYLGADYHFDLVRPGFALYGGNPVEGENPMESVVSLEGRILQVQNVKVGDEVGYNGTWVAEKEGRIATVEVGYADVNPLKCVGYHRGETVEVVGRMSMDMLTFDITHIREYFDNMYVVPEVEGLAGYHFLTSISNDREYYYD